MIMGRWSDERSCIVLQVMVVVKVGEHCVLSGDVGEASDLRGRMFLFMKLRRHRHFYCQVYPVGWWCSWGSVCEFR